MRSIVPPDVSVIIANYAGDAVLRSCVASIHAQTSEPNEVLVVDAGPGQNAAALIRASDARVLQRPNRGLGYLYNEGARAATSELLLLINNDVELAPDCLEILTRALMSVPDAFATDPRQLGHDGSLIHGRATLRRGPILRQPLPGFRLDLVAPADEDVDTVSANGAAMLVRRDRLLALDGFDETMFLDFEDIDLCWRAWCRGWRSVHVPAATVCHHVGVATREAGVLRRRLQSSHHNLLRFSAKCFPVKDVARVVADELLRLPRHPRLVAPALLRVVLELPEILAARHAIRPSAALMAWILSGQPTEAHGSQS